MIGDNIVRTEDYILLTFLKFLYGATAKRKKYFLFRNVIKCGLNTKTGNRQLFFGDF